VTRLTQRSWTGVSASGSPSAAPRKMLHVAPTTQPPRTVHNTMRYDITGFVETVCFRMQIFEGFSHTLL